MLKVLPKQTASMQTRDGVRLDADIYRPDADGEFPVLLMRQPYGRAIASTVVYAHPTWYASQGYIIVIQDVRGRGTSEGEFQLFTHEITDGDYLRTFPNLPTPTHKFYFLSTTGLASIREDSGTLSNAPCPMSSDVLVHNPWRPVPAVGGHAAIPAGVLERSHIDCRSDVLIYTSEPLVENLHLAGDVMAKISCTADQPSYDLCAVLSEVYPDGRVYNLTQGYVHCRDGASNVSTKIQLQPTCARIAKGNALRLSLSAACFPAYAMNSGNGAVITSDNLRDAEIITLTVNCGGEGNSQVVLPDLSSYRT